MLSHNPIAPRHSTSHLPTTDLTKYCKIPTRYHTPLPLQLRYNYQQYLLLELNKVADKSHNWKFNQPSKHHVIPARKVYYEPY